MNWLEIKRVYFIGIGGIGMSALARYCKQQGKKVSGYDKAETTLTQELTLEGINVHYEENMQFADKDADIIVYTPAIPTDHLELSYFRKHGYVLLKRSDLLQEITRHNRTIAIAGTHGKTTTTTLVAHILRDSGFGCTAFLGGISTNYQTNYWSSENNIIVVEADEYDRSFHKLHPYVSIITSCDADHLDIYHTHEALLEAFQHFADLTDINGLLVYRDLLPVHHFSQISYDVIRPEANVHATNLQLKNGYYYFDVQHKNETITDFMMPVPGLHNVENALAAISVCKFLGLEDNKIRNAVTSFKGVKRRFEILVDTSHVTYIDDYAHHPAEIAAAIQALRVFRPNKKLTVVFQPHLYSRTQDFAQDFARSLSKADEVILLPIYPARELPILGVTSDMLISLIKNIPARLVDKSQLLMELEKEKFEVLCTLGAGDIDQFAKPIQQMLQRR